VALTRDRSYLTQRDESAGVTDWPVKHIICGISELPDHSAAGVTHVLSILDPEVPDPASLAAFPPGERLTLRFHDIIDPFPGMIAPARPDIEALLAFGRRLPQDGPAHLLVHCHMGVSRSTAAAAALLLQAHPQANEQAVLDHIIATRPQAWPNSRMIVFADELLQRRGRLIAALGRHYRRQLDANPSLAEPMRAGGRGAEVDMAA
jgi:predicted protein tyrosine phosphatase